MGSKSLVNKSVSVPDIKKEADDLDVKDKQKAMKEIHCWYDYEQGGGGRRGSSSDGSSDDLESRPSSSPTSRELPAGRNDVPVGFMCCSWCQKVGSDKQFSLKTPNSNKAFCSEHCFTQSRRANFKRNKTCDWCKHVRHTVNYVDFQDGEIQLQFCSDKCLNQYKMNIFCKEAQAHLELHPESAKPEATEKPSSNHLITPDLWMRDCRSQSPDTDKSSTPPRIPSPLVEIKTTYKAKQKLFPNEMAASRRKFRRSPRRSAASIIDHRRPSSPHSPESEGSPPLHGTLRGSNPNFHPGGFLPEPNRPMFLNPRTVLPGQPNIPDVRFSHHRHSLRNMLHHPPGIPPPLLPLGRPVQPPFSLLIYSHRPRSYHLQSQ